MSDGVDDVEQEEQDQYDHRNAHPYAAEGIGQFALHVRYAGELDIFCGNQGDGAEAAIAVIECDCTEDRALGDGGMEGFAVSFTEDDNFLAEIVGIDAGLDQGHYRFRGTESYIVGAFTEGDGDSGYICGGGEDFLVREGFKGPVVDCDGLCEVICIV